MKKILFVHSVGALGGAERMSLSLMEQLNKVDFSCFIATPENGDFVEKCEASGVVSYLYSPIQPSLTSPIKSLKNSLQWRGILSDIKPDIIHTADLLSTRSISGVAASLNIPVIFHAHFPFSEDFAKWALRKPPSKVIFCSGDLLSTHREILAKCSRNIDLEVIHNGVDINLFTASTISNDIPQIGIIANLQERKGHKEFIEMAALVINAGVEAKFHIIGGDIMQTPREPLLKAMALEKGVLEMFTFHGQVSDVRALVSSLDIIVCASYEEAFPVSILEGMAMRKAIVSTNVNGIPEAIEHMSSGLLVKPRTSKALADSVLKLLANTDLKENLANNALKRVHENFSIDAYITKWTKCYNSLLSVK